MITLLAVTLMLTSLPEVGAPGREYRAAVVELGKAIDVARSQGLDEQALARWLTRTDELRRRALATRHAAEAAAGEDEARLEQVFRSAAWSELSFTLAATRYWQSWLALDRYGFTRNPTDLSVARHGFQTTLVLIVYPGLVRGSWLGLGYAALAENDYAKARVWFDRVAAGDDALAATATTELALLGALAGEAPVVAASVTDDEARVLEAEALALLKRHGETLDGARAAAERLRALEAGGQMTRARVDRVLAFRNQVIGHDIGPVGYLVSAEDALDHQQFYTAVQKYQAFFEAISATRAKAFASYRLRYADALIASGLADRALRELAHAEPGATAASLRHLATAMLYAASGDAPARRDYLSAARKAEDAAAAFSQRLLSSDVASARSVLRRRADDPWLVRTPTFEVTYRELSRGENADALAALALERLRRLDKKTRKAPWARIIEVELESYVADDLEKVLRDLDRLAEELEAADAAGRLFGLRAAVLARRDGDGLVRWLQSLNAPVDAEQRTHLLINVLGCDSKPWCLAATDALVPLVADDPVNSLHLELQRARLLAAAGRQDEVYYLARSLVDAYPASGDAWKLYAVAAREVGRAGDADQAYARIAGSVPTGSTAWRDAQRQRLELRVSAGARAEACELVDSVKADAATYEMLSGVLETSGIPCRP